jgi:alkylglycerol monooxygenase
MCLNFIFVHMALNPVILSIPIFLVLISAEVIYDRIKNRSMYRLNDAITNISCGIVEQVTGLFAKVFTVAAYYFIYENFRFFDVPNAWYWWVVAFIGVDFFYYWAHRMSHQVNLLWLGHIVHHQSEDYNLSVALRQSTFQKMLTFYFYFPLAFFGFPTEWFVLIGAYNLLYQFWIHTEVIGRMGVFELIFNTPAHHRVHHGRDPKYIDKNHGGTLIIWDRLFGTFQQEEETPTYGVTKPTATFNVVYANLKPFKELWDEMKVLPGFKNKLLLAVMPPGWYPESMGGFRPAPPVVKSSYVKYDVLISKAENYYLFFQYLVILGGTALFLFNVASLNLPQQIAIACLIIYSVMSLGLMFESRKYARWIEIFRILILSVLTGVMLAAVVGPILSTSIAVFYGLISLIALQIVLAKPINNALR